MKAPLGKRAIASRFCLILVLLFAVSAWTFSISAAQQGAEKSAEQTAAGTANEPQQTQPAPQTADQPPPPQPAPEGLNPGAEATADAPGFQTPQQPGAAAPQPEPALASCPPEYVPLIQRTTASLMSADFNFIPAKALDPFAPFITLETTTQPRMSEEEEAMGGPMTPLQKMTLTEIENGLRAIIWGDLGRKAVIEDSTGKGFIVSVGTPAGEHGGVITQIFNDHLIIQQQMWDRMARKRSPQDFTIKLVKKVEGK